MKLGFTKHSTHPLIYVDNQNAIRVFSNPEYHQHTKEIDIQYHVIRDFQICHLVQLVYVGADILTKALLAENLTTSGLWRSLLVINEWKFQFQLIILCSSEDPQRVELLNECIF